MPDPIYPTRPTDVQTLASHQAAREAVFDADLRTIASAALAKWDADASKPLPDGLHVQALSGLTEYLTGRIYLPPHGYLTPETIRRYVGVLEAPR